MPEPQRPPFSPPPPPRVPPAPPPRPPIAGDGTGVANNRMPPTMQTMQMPAAARANPAAMPAAAQTAQRPPAAPPPQRSVAQPATPVAARMPAPGVGPSPGHPTLEQLIVEANEKGYSDVHVGVGEVPRCGPSGSARTACRSVQGSGQLGPSADIRE